MLRIIKNKLVLLLIITVSMLLVMGLYVGDICEFEFIQRPIAAIVYPFQKTFSYVTLKVDKCITYFEDLGELKAENRELKETVNALEKYIAQINWLEEENFKLRQALELKNTLEEYEFIGGNVIAKDAGNWFEIFTVDRGTKDCIEKNNFVIFDRGLVGRVYKVGLNTANIISILDQDSVVSARISKTRDLVVVKGDLKLKNEGLCKLEYIPSDVELEVGDMIETSGIGEFFPKGIEIGMVKEIIQKNGNLDRYAIIQPSVDLKKIEEVLILTKK